MKKPRQGTGLFFLGIGMALGAAAETAVTTPVQSNGIHPQTRFTRQTVWEMGIGSGFRKDAMEAAIAVGAGPGSNAFGSRRTHDLTLVSGSVGWVFSDVVGRDRWWRGNFELVGELFSGWQFHPSNRYFVGLTPLLRYNFATGSRWAPFIDLGAGVSVTNIGKPDLSSKFQFNVQGGAGVRYFILDDMAVMVLYRYLHFFNADLQKPNTGANTHTFRIGLGWFF
jgi:lipid A 3-O-deacylase